MVSFNTCKLHHSLDLENSIDLCGFMVIVLLDQFKVKFTQYLCVKTIHFSIINSSTSRAFDVLKLIN